MLAVLVAAGGFLSLGGPIAAHQDAAFEVLVVDFAFEPATVTVPAGATVTWTNTGSRPHTVTADDGSFDSGRLDPGEQFSQTFDQPGTFTYHCGFHPEMQGSIVVTEPQEEADESDTTPDASRRRRATRRRPRLTSPRAPRRLPAPTRRDQCAISSRSSSRAWPTSTPAPAKSSVSSSTPFPTSGPFASTKARRLVWGRSS